MLFYFLVICEELCFSHLRPEAGGLVVAAGSQQPTGGMSQLHMAQLQVPFGGGQ